LPIFLAAVGVGLAGNPLEMAFNLTAYSIGMGTVLSTLGLVAATTGVGVGGLSPRGALAVKKLGAVLLLAAAAYIIFYWGRVVFGDVMVENRVISAGGRVSSTLGGWLSSGAGKWAVALAFAGLLLAALAGALTVRARSRMAANYSERQT
jgi:hypothetical protein